MPCWTINLISVELKAADKNLLERAIKALNWEHNRVGDVFHIGSWMQIYGNRIVTKASNQDRVNALKRQYSIEVVKEKARLKGWTASWQKTSTGTKAVLTKW